MQNVYTLLCKRDLDMALITLPSIVQSLLPGQQFIVADDGSFDEQTKQAVLAISPQISVITKKERESIVMEEIRKFPHCIRYREELPLSFKLIDIPLLVQRAGDKRFTFTDSDIIYYRGCEGYFQREDNTYLRTDAIKLSVKLQHGLLSYRWKMPLRFNSGYFSFGMQDYDSDFINYYLGLPNIRNSPWLSEQTCWSLLFGRAGKSYCPNENEFACREDFTGPNPNIKAIHLIGKLKNKATEWGSYYDSCASTLHFEPSRNINLTDWAIKSFKRKIRFA